MAKTRYCPECGSPIEVVNMRGQETPFQRAKVKIDFDFEVLGCKPCGEFFLNGNQAKELDQKIQHQLDRTGL